MHHQFEMKRPFRLFSTTASQAPTSHGKGCCDSFSPQRCLACKKRSLSPSSLLASPPACLLFGCGSGRMQQHKFHTRNVVKLKESSHSFAESICFYLLLACLLQELGPDRTERDHQPCGPPNYATVTLRACVLHAKKGGVLRIFEAVACSAVAPGHTTSFLRPVWSVPLA